MDEREQQPESGPFPEPGRASHPDPGGGPVPGAAQIPESDADGDFEEWAAWVDREVAAGRDPVPPEWTFAGQGLSVSLGDAAEIDRELLAAISGQDGLSAEVAGPQFAQGSAADLVAPSPVLAALTEAAVCDVTRLTDDQLIGVLQAARRQENREAWKKALVIAEFARRRTTEFEAATARGVPTYCRPGQFPGEELAVELVAGPVHASHAIDDATDLTTRLPRTLAGMAAGLIDEARAGVIALHTRSLTPDDAALADGILAALAPALRLDQLTRKAAALEMKLAPEAVKARREHARRTRQRVEVRREESGNASVAGREMDNSDALASRAHIHALALRLRHAGMPGTLDQLRLLVFADLTAGRNPLDRLARPAAGAAPTASAGPDPTAPSPTTNGSQANSAVEDGLPPGCELPLDCGRRSDASDEEEETADEDDEPQEAQGVQGVQETQKAQGVQETQEAQVVLPQRGLTQEALGQDAPPGTATGGSDRACLDYAHDEGDADDDSPDIPGHARPSAPMPALINLVVHAGTLFGWDTTPAEAGGWGLLDADETRTIVAAASQHPATRWCLTLLGPQGTAIAHGCSPGQHPWAPPNRQDTSVSSATNTGDQWDIGGPPNPGAPGSPGIHVGHSRTVSPRTPTPVQAARLAAFLQSLNVLLTPVAKGGCDHASAEPRYTPSRRLAHLARARTATCDAPGCAAQASHADLDHTVPYPDGPTDQCNLGPKCRRHHKTKQAPDWKVEQPEPGIIRWTLPSGRTHTTGPTVYVSRLS